jgi:hypothetical protein
MSEYYYDDPIEEPVERRRNPVSALGAVALLIVGGLFLHTTLAANINIGLTGRVEFGQGVSLLTSCSGNTAIRVTPSVTFNNVTGGGSYNFTSVTVANIPSTCINKQFTLTGYQSDGTPVALFNGNTSLVVTGDGTIISTALGVNGVSVTSSYNAGVGSFVATFTTTPASAALIKSIAVQSSDATFAPGYSLGQVGPGGGIIFYLDANGFTETGAPCGSSCHYLEFAPNTWSGGTSDPSVLWSSDQSHVAMANDSQGQDGTFNQAFGMGFKNTQDMMTSNPVTGYVADTSEAAYRVTRYAGTDNSAGKWFLPSYMEARAMFQSSVMNSGGFSPLGFGNCCDIGRYWTSSEASSNQAWQTRYDAQVGMRGKNETIMQARPIRAF